MEELICTNEACERVGKVQGKSQEPQFWECSCCWTGYNLDLKPEPPPPDDATITIAAVRDASDFAALKEAVASHLELRQAKTEDVPVEQVKARVEATAAMLRERK